MLDAPGHRIRDLVRRPVGTCEDQSLGRPRWILRVELRVLVPTTARPDEEEDQQPEHTPAARQIADPAIEAELLQQGIQPLVKRMTRRPRIPCVVSATVKTNW